MHNVNKEPINQLTSITRALRLSWLENACSHSFSGRRFWPLK